jgi:hypothetical protein
MAQRIDTAKRFTPADSINKIAAPIADKKKVDSVLKNHSPRTAAIRSAILPGLGQIYNKKYWKLPIVYGALGISGSIFLYNLKNYKELRFAYKARIEASTPIKDPVTGAIRYDSTNYFTLKQVYKTLDATAIQSYRNDFRRNVDYSALFFILLWGLNVVDATVDAHLKSFDVSPDLSFKFHFGHSEMAGTNGVSFIVALK